MTGRTLACLLLSTLPPAMLSAWMSAQLSAQVSAAPLPAGMQRGIAGRTLKSVIVALSAPAEGKAGADTAAGQAAERLPRRVANATQPTDATHAVQAADGAPAVDAAQATGATQAAGATQATGATTEPVSGAATEKVTSEAADDVAAYLPAAQLTERPQLLRDIPRDWRAEDRLPQRMVCTLLVSEYGDVDRVLCDEPVVALATLQAVGERFRAARFAPGRLYGRPVRSALRIELRLD